MNELPPSVYWRRRIVAIAAAVLAVVLLSWLIGALISADEPVGQPSNAAAVSTPPSTVDTTVSPASSSAATSVVTTSPPPPPPPPGPPQACPDDVIGVTAVPEKPSYPVGTQVGLAMQVSNTGQVPCIRDIGRHLRELVVLTADGHTLLWSSNHCLATAGTEVRVLQPGEKFDYGTKWVGSTSEPGCAKHTRLGPGDYLLVAKVGGKASTPVVFRLT